jgi:hypothetical protein
VRDWLVPALESLEDRLATAGVTGVDNGQLVATGYGEHPVIQPRPPSRLKGPKSEELI